METTIRKTCGQRQGAPGGDTELLGGPWGLVTTYDWAYNLNYNPPKWAYRGYPNYR